MKTIRDSAIVLRNHKLGEADRIITLLTRNHGQLRAVARGVRKTSSKIGARLEPFSVVDVQIRLSERCELHSITQVMFLAAWGPKLAQDYRLYTGACLMAETVERLTDNAPISSREYLLTLGALQALAQVRNHPTLIVDSFLLRIFAISGWAPSCFDCALCSSPGPHSLFSTVSGGMVCAQCAPAGSIRLTAGAVTLLPALLAGNWPVAEASSEAERIQCSQVIRSFAQWHSERRLKSLPLLELV